MDFAIFARAVFALAITLGLVGLGAVALRRFGGDCYSYAQLAGGGAWS